MEDLQGETVVENILPTEALLQHGIYMQTCAHIEWTVWQIVQRADRRDLLRQEVLEKHVDDKLVTTRLLAALRSCAKRLPAPLALETLSLAQRIAEGLDARNMAAHGAFFSDPGTDEIQVEHFQARGRKENRKRYRIDGRYSLADIMTTVKEADAILRDAVRLRDRVQQYINLPSGPIRVESCQTAIYLFLG